MNRNELLNDKKELKEQAGRLTPFRMMYFYEKYMNGADEYLLGVEFNGMVYGYFTKEIELRYCSCQTDKSHLYNNEYLRFRPHLWGAQEIAAKQDAICFGTTDYVYSLYTCNTKSGINKGYCFEKAVCNYFNLEWNQDNKPSTKGGDIFYNGKEVQLKFAAKESLATITSTDKIIKRIDNLLKDFE